MQTFVMALVMGTAGGAGCMVGTEWRAGGRPIHGAAVPAAVPSGGGGGEPAIAGGTVEAGCTFSGRDLKGEPGTELEVSCPANCTEGNAWGTRTYYYDSSVCRAGIHSGAIPMSGGIVEVRIETGRPAYRGSKQHRIESRDWGQGNGSFTVLNGKADEAAAAEDDGPQVVEAGCSYRGNEVVGDVGTHVVVSCPAGCLEKAGGIWGTGVYTADTGVCLAGIHSGIITDKGGEVGITIEKGRPAYRGSTQHGIQSNDFGNYGKSFRVASP